MNPEAKKKALMNYIYALISTLAETEAAPSGHCYAAAMGLGLSLEDHNFVIALCQAQGLLTMNKSHLLTITDKGRKAAGQIDARLSA